MNYNSWFDRYDDDDDDDDDDTMFLSRQMIKIYVLETNKACL